MEIPLQEDISNHKDPSANFISVYDAVRSKGCGRIGLVIAGDEFDFYDSSSLSSDQLEVLWEDDTNIKLVNHDDVTLVSKGFLAQGRFVASALDPSGQIGIATDVNIFVDLLAPDGEIIKNVNTRELIRVKDFCLSSMVQLGPWIGFVDDIVDNVTVLFDNGTVSEFINASEMCLEPVEKVVKIDGSFPNYPGYYPGQRVKRQFWKFLLPGLRKPKVLEGTITKVTVESVRVNWYRYAGWDRDDYFTKPDEKQIPENLKKLPFFSYDIWVLFARCLWKDFEGVLKIVNVKKKVDVTWQDGTLGKGLDSTTLIVKHEASSDFFPEQFVQMKSTQENDDRCETRRFGIVRSVDSKEKTALVRWQYADGESGHPQQYDDEEEISIYELEIHPEYKYFFADLVCWPAEVVSTSRDVIDLPRIGCITGLENGIISVLWDDGTDTKVLPEEISQTIGIEGADFAVDNDYDDYGLKSDGSETSREKSFFDLMEALDWVGLIKRLFLWDLTQFYRFSMKPSHKESELRCQKIIRVSSSKSFDVAEDPSDHYFFGADELSNNASKKWLKKVQEDWKILQNDLPGGIFVRVYEDRMDLLRAMIVGPYGTPYQDGLFFFDFYFPPEYPDVPPVVHYYSGGWRINPNLYEDGKICLSLLNTWHGKGTEVWDASSSSILQIVVSIQGLILNSKPYFNEAGYEKLIGSSNGDKDSLSYNENTYLLNCKRMIHIMCQPLKGFEELAREHFIGRSYYILKACDAYLKGYLIGSLNIDASPSKNSKPNANSNGFKRTLAKNIIPKLFVALNEVGADCHDFEYLIQI